MNYKMLVSDIDGTLLSDDRLISKDNLDLIRSAIDDGLVFVLCTGRMLPSAQEIGQIIDRDIPIIATNGSLTYVDGMVKSSYSLSLPNLRAVEEASKTSDIPLFYYGQDSFYMTDLSKDIFKQVYKNPKFDHQQFIIDSIEDLEEKDIYKAFFYSMETDRLEALKKRLGSLEEVNVTSSHWTNIEINHLKATKGQAISDLAQSLDIGLDQVIAIGDNHNDLTMIETAGLGVAVANGIEEIKDLADVTTVSNNQNALAQVIKDYFYA